MFHTYVTASSGRKVDIDRARYLMDDELYAEAHRELIKTMSPYGFNPFDIACFERNVFPTTESKAWEVWRNYCRRHLAKYGEPFAPDVDPNWDQ